eukprot:16396126-Heterocapsa_arctica.AAC.1
MSDRVSFLSLIQDVLDDIGADLAPSFDRKGNLATVPPHVRGEMALLARVASRSTSASSPSPPASGSDEPSGFLP